MDWKLIANTQKKHDMGSRPWQLSYMECISPKMREGHNI